jgi:predicted nucleic acid-binding protein
MPSDRSVTRGQVVDSSVIVAARADSGPDGVWSERVLSTGRLVAPHLAVVEVMNILRRLELSGGLSELESTSARADLDDLSLHLVPIRPVSDRIGELRRNVTCYDASYIAVAEALELPFATLDRRLARAPGLRCEVMCP